MLNALSKSFTCSLILILILIPADPCLAGLRRIVTPYSAHLTVTAAVSSLGEQPRTLPHHPAPQGAELGLLQPTCPPLQHRGQ